MTTHHLNDDNQSGYFAGDNGQHICRWTWATETKVLSVRAGQITRPVDLSSHGFDNLSDDELLERLINIAKSTGIELGADFGD